MKKRKNEFEVVYLDDDEIVLEEDKRKLLPFSWFFFKYGRIITTIFVSLAILSFVGGVALTLSNLSQVTPPVITNPGVTLEFDETDNTIDISHNAITKDYAEMLFENRVNGIKIKDKFKNCIDVISVGNDRILIFENNVAVIIYGNKDKLPLYVPNKDNVKVEGNNIVISGNTFKVVTKNVLPDNSIVYEFENKMLLIEKDNKYRLIAKEDIIYDKEGNILEEYNPNDIEDIINVEPDKVLIFENNVAVVIYGDKDKLPVYISNKDNVIVENNKITINGDIIKTVNRKVLPDKTIVYEFENGKVLIEKNGEYKLVEKKDIIYDSNGNIINTNNDMNFSNFTVTNNTENEVLKYIVVLEETSKSNNEKVLPQYVYYKISVNDKIQPSNVVNNKVWEKGSTIAGDLKIKNNTYILYEGEVEKLATDKFSLGMWLDYETIGNDMQDKWFIGTLKVYAWIE